MIEINTGVTTGDVTPAAAMAKRFKAAGIPDSDIFVGGPRPDKHNVVARIQSYYEGQEFLYRLVKALTQGVVP